MTKKNQWGEVRCDLGTVMALAHCGEAEVPDKGNQSAFIYDKGSWGGAEKRMLGAESTLTV